MKKSIFAVYPIISMRIKDSVISTNWYLFLLLLIEGGALMAVEIISAKLVAPFYGTSLYVWTAVLAITIAGLAAGYSLGGALSKKQNSSKFLIFVVSVSALLVFLMPYTSVFVMAITAKMNLSIGVIVTCMLLLLPPVVCFGTVGPLSVKYLSRKLENIGHVAGLTYFTSTIGGIIATFLFSFYIIPFMGLKAGTLIAASALAIVFLIFVVTRKKFKNAPAVNSPVISEKKNTIKEKTDSAAIKKQDNATVKNTMYLLALLEGVAVMVIELFSARMVAPYFGSSLYVWGTVIGITLFGLALGYYAGGIVADRKPSENTFPWILLLASVFIMLMPWISNGLTVCFEDFNPVAAVLIICIFLILPPLLFLGTIPTLVIRYITVKVEASGNTTGKVYAFSSMGSILGLFLTGYFIIPVFGISGPSVVTGLLLGIIPFLMLIRKKKYKAVLFFVALAIAIGSQKEKPAADDIKIQYYSEGLLGQILVSDVVKPPSPGSNANVVNRILFINRMGQNFYNLNQGKSIFGYIDYISALAAKLPEKSDVLVLGLGGGVSANALHKKYKCSVDAVDLDQRMAYIAKCFFGLENDISIIIDDARHYIETTGKKYDLIVFDVFNGETWPSHVLTLESFKKTKKLLKESGFIIINFNGFLSGVAGKSGRCVYKTLCASGMETRLLPTAGKEDERNILFVTSPGKLNFSSLKLIGGKQKEFCLDSLFLEPEKIATDDAEVLTDDIPNLDMFNLEAGKIWRKGYNKYFTKNYTRKGIPLFK